MVRVRNLLAAACCVMCCRAADFPVLANIRYAPYAETLLDVWQPRSPALQLRGAVLVIHGEGSEAAVKEAMLPFCSPFLERDWVAVAIDYRPDSALEDTLRAAKWFHNHAADFKADPNRLIALGVSAGGQLALLSAMLPESAAAGPLTKFAAVINFGASGQAEDEKSSPARYIRKGLPAVLSIHGRADEVVPYEQAAAFTRTLQEAGVKADLIAVPGGKHSLTPEQTAALWPQIFKWLKKNKLP